MSFKREDFKGASTKKLKTLKEQEDAMIGSSSSNTTNIELVEGVNKIRLAPPFPGEDDFKIMIKRYWVPYEKDDGDITRVPVFDSIVHGGTKKDICNEYIDFCKRKLPEEKGGDEKLKALTDWKNGLTPQILWESYAWKLQKDVDPKFGEFEIRRNLRDELNSLSIIEDDDEAIDIDPFTDAEEGTPIVVTMTTKIVKKKKKIEYSTKLAKNQFPLTDEMFEQLTKSKPLSEKYRNNYTIEDFEKALDGLKIFDTENEIDAFDEDEFQEIIAEVKAQYEKPTSKKSSKKSDDDDEDEKPTSKKSDDEQSTPKRRTPQEIRDEILRKKGLKS